MENKLIKTMKKLTFLLISLVFACNSVDDNQNQSSKELESIIQDYNDHKGYDKEKYPLGLQTRAFYKEEAEYAEQLLKKFDNIKVDELNENEQISVELLKFVLQDKIDFYTFESFLNPLLSDSGFHSDLNYMVRPLTDLKSAKEYLNKLNAIPEFVSQGLENLRGDGILSP